MFILIRSMLIVVRGDAGNVFAGWRLSESTYRTLIFEMLFARNSIDVTAIEWGAK
jgi:hypothetical protein